MSGGLAADGPDGSRNPKCSSGNPVGPYSPSSLLKEWPVPITREDINAWVALCRGMRHSGKNTRVTLLTSEGLDCISFRLRTAPGIQSFCKIVLPSKNVLDHQSNSLLTLGLSVLKRTNSKS